MSDTLLRLYHWLPAPMRSVAVNVWGLHLHSWRYGPETDQLVEEALERERWYPKRWRAWQEERLAYVLHRAATRVPYYQEQWSVRRRHGDRASWEYLENWPILEKEPLRQNPIAFVANDRNIRHMYHDYTSGSTGTPLDLWLSRETVRAWYALFEARLRRWNGVSRQLNWAILGGQPVVPAARDRPPFWVWNTAMNQLYLSVNHVSRQNASAYLEALRHYRITHMVVYPSSAAVLAREAIDLGLRPLGLKVVITNAEPLFPWQRDAIRWAFGCEVRETYGMAEIVSAAGECPSGVLHLWPEVGWLEVLSDLDDARLPAGNSGRLVATGLLNADMPLIRYAVGDRGRAAVMGEGCGCGRTLPALAGLEGRVNDLLITKDGRRVYCPLSSILHRLPIREAQLIQETLDRLRVRYVPTPTFTREDESLIIKRLRARMGAVEVILEQLVELPRAQNGKLRPVVCNLPSNQKEQLRQAPVREAIPS
jgi:phenylacetate-CoA ligase